MPGTCVIGLQWGDEAKGKLVDLLTADYKIVVRYQGGANAGHTVVGGGQTYKLHLIPSGILNPGVTNVVGPGVVLHPPKLLEEVAGLRQRGVEVGGNLLLSDRSHLVFPWHVLEDRLWNDQPIGGEMLGTTLRGIGPCYRDKVGRTYAIRLGDLYHDSCRERIERIVEFKTRLFAAAGSRTGSQGGTETEGSEFQLDAARIHEEFQGYAEQLRPFVADTTNFLLDAVESGQPILLEGAQGALLDIDHGTFPFVTSSNSSGVGVSAGSGIPPKWIRKVIGVAKAYSTRVGGGPFPTEQDNEVGQRIRELGREYGTTTGRPRRCGWFDAVAVRYTARLSGVDGLALMMMDVLSQLPEVKVCVAYELRGQRIDRFPGHVDDLRQVRPVYETFPGWQQDVSGLRRLEQFPSGARRYLDRVSELVGCPIEIVSVGPDREQTIFARRDP
ncbi:MAG: adenylosuccinate synthase [Pirellulaceae bacterium]|nr:adenylosuccinate synthase [Pirellulaceae bacterium]